MLPIRWMTNTQWKALPIKERALLMAAQDADLHNVREIGGANRGAMVETYLRSVGLGAGHPWCAAFVTYHLIQQGIDPDLLPQNAASVCNWLTRSKFTVHSDPKKAGRGDLFGWCDSRRWQGHIGFVVRVYRVLGVWWIETIEGNTNAEGSREGDGVYRKRRRVTKNMRFVTITNGGETA